MKKKTKIVGLCGPSGSGKTTLAKLLAEKLNASTVGLDNYFLLDTPYKKYGEQGKDLELPENTDWLAINKLIDTIKDSKPAEIQTVSWKNNKNTLSDFKYGDMVIIEGFLLFHDVTVVDKLDLSVYIDISDKEGVDRRVAREGSEENRRWFEKVTFPEYKERREIFKSRADLVIDGTENLNKNLKLIIEKISKL